MTFDNLLEKSTHYKGKVEVVFDPKKHSYTINGKRTAGVTTALSIIDKSRFLIWWAVGKMYEYLENKWDINADYDEISKKAVLDMAKNAHTRHAKEAIDIGDLVHKFVESFIKAKLAKKESPALPKNEIAKRACEKFISWVDKHKVEFLFSEKKLAYWGS